MSLITDRPLSWWTSFASGPRRDREFYLRVRQREHELKRGVPTWLSESNHIPEGANCEVCGKPPVAVLSAAHMYELGLPMEQERFQLTFANFKDDTRPRFFCIKCLETEVFPAIDRKAGNTTTEILRELQKEHMGVPVPNRRIDLSTQNGLTGK